MDQAERDRIAYSEARRFLLRFKDQGVTEHILDKYLHFSEIQRKPETLAGIYQAILASAQNIMTGQSYWESSGTSTT